MKVKWEGKRIAKTPVFGLYKRMGLFKLGLVCYFLDRGNGLETKRYMGRGYVLRECKMP